MKKIIALLLIVFTIYLSKDLWASCSGSSPTWTSTNDLTSINTCISNASSGDTINVLAGGGTATWSGGLTLPKTKKINLIGPGASNLTVTLTGSLVLYCSGSIVHRVSGFTFTGSTEPLVLIQGSGSGFRFDHNIITSPPSEWMTISAIVDLEGWLYGLIDNNTVNSTNNTRININSGNIDYGTRGNWVAGTMLGQATNIFIEDNTFNFSTQNDPGLGVVDSNSGAAWVFRNNYCKNCSLKSHGVCNAEGTANQSAYRNQFVCDSGITSCYRAIHQQGSGEAVYFNNTFTASGSKSSSAIEVLHYRSANAGTAGCTLYPRCDGNAANATFDGNTSPTGTYYGYRCRYQPGSKASASGTGTAYSPQYVWNNKWTDTEAQVVLAISDAWGSSNPSVNTHVQKDRDIYEGAVTAQTSATSPFDGTSGVGFGTLANRPTTCTTSSESGGGVGYFATDQGSQGTLYRCSATNTWTAHYTPYTYPHPLQGEDATPPTLSSAVISANGTTFTLTFNEAVTQGGGYNDNQLDVDCSTAGDNLTLTYGSGNGTNAHVYTLGTEVDYGDTCNIDFNGTANSLEDGAGNDLAAIVSGSVTNNATDDIAPVVTEFTVPETSNQLLIFSSTFSCTDAVGVTGYIMNESAEAPLASADGWTGTAPTSYTFGTEGAKTLYGYCKDAAGNVSLGTSDTITITLPAGGILKVPWLIVP